jgi:hypothetical protein
LTEVFDFSATIIGREIEIQRYCSALLPTIPRPFQPLPRIFVLGDEAVFPLAWRVVKVCDESCQFVPIYIRDIHPIDLVSPGSNASQFAYNREFQTLPPESMVILAFGSLEGQELIRRHPSEEASSGVGPRELQIRAITQIAKHIWRQKHCTVWIHPFVVQFDAKDYFHSLRQANAQLAAWIWTVNRDIPGIRMLDVIGAMVDSDSKWRPEFAYDDKHLRPAYIGLIEQVLNAEVPPGAQAAKS